MTQGWTGVGKVRAREADIRKAQSEFYPKISIGGNVLQNIGRVRTNDFPGWSGVDRTGYGASIAIEVPIFDGGLRKNRLGEAESKRRVAEERFRRNRFSGREPLQRPLAHPRVELDRQRVLARVTRGS